MGNGDRRRSVGCRRVPVAYLRVPNRSSSKAGGRFFSPSSRCIPGSYHWAGPRAVLPDGKIRCPTARKSIAMCKSPVAFKPLRRTDTLRRAPAHSSTDYPAAVIFCARRLCSEPGAASRGLPPGIPYLPKHFTYPPPHHLIHSPSAFYVPLCLPYIPLKYFTHPCYAHHMSLYIPLICISYIPPMYFTHPSPYAFHTSPFRIS